MNKSALANQLYKTHRRSIIDVTIAYVVAGLLIGAVVLIWIYKDIPVGHFTRDPANTFKFAFYVGSISSMGHILWTSTASLCLFSAYLLRSDGQNGNENWLRNFLFASGLLTLALLFDDIFLFHEEFFPIFLNISDYVTFSIYALATLTILLVFWRVILQTHFLILYMAVGLLGLGMVADKLMDASTDTSIKFLVEDGLKFFGITTWFVYYLRLAIDTCTARKV